MLKQSHRRILLSILVPLWSITTPIHAVEKYKISSNGGARQIWFEAEDFDERNPEGDQYYPVVDAADAFGQAITRAGGAGGMIQWTFNISKTGGQGGTWYFWARQLNPSNASDYMLVAGDPGDADIPTGPPFAGGDGPPFDNADDRVFEIDVAPSWGWAQGWDIEGHTKELQDGENTMYIFHRQGNDTVFWDVFMWTDSPDYVPTDKDYENATAPVLGAASGPVPSAGIDDVIRDVVLTWVPGEFAVTHNVYFGTDFDSVNADSGTALVSEGQTEAAYDPEGVLTFGQTYYWRVDEVNGPPDNTVYRGEVWSFEIEPFSYPIEGVTATASGSSSPDAGPEKTVDGSGLDALDQHSTMATDMWLSNADGQAWIQYAFDSVYKLHEMWVWNSNQMIESFVGLGARDVTIETSQDGEAWIVLEDAPEFAQATGLANYTANTVVDFGGAMARFVRITINAGWGMMPQNGLSEVRFFYIPTTARAPQPPANVTLDDLDIELQWRAGRGAVAHDVSLSTDRVAVAEGAAVIGTTSVPNFDPGALDYDTTYFWKVDEVNQAGTPTTHAGDIWSFTTPAYGIVDDFDQYNDKCNRIFFAWADGLGHNGGNDIDDCDVPASNGNGGGSIVGHDQAPFAERTIVTADSTQSLPFNYDNAFGPSEATLTFDGQDWTASAVRTLSLAFYGTAGNTGTLYIKINNTKVVYELDPTDIARASWQGWNIDLGGISDLQNVTSLTIGVDGANAAGVLYIDDIRLYPQAGDG